MISPEVFFERNQCRFAGKTREEIAFESVKLTEEYRELIRSHIKRHNPEISETDLKIELFKWFYEGDFTYEELNNIIAFFNKKTSK